ncbi:MAG: hypothetical protein R3E68_03725 [Burkholderiaceae bacterium]
MRTFAAIALMLGLAVQGTDDSAVRAQQLPDNSVGAVAGVWMLRYKDAVGQEYVDVLELKENGNYTKHAKGWMADRGSYSVKGSTIAFRSAVSARLNSDITFKRLGKEAIGFQSGAPLNIKTEWTRVKHPPNLETTAFDSRQVPGGLPGLLTNLAQDAQSWHADALPTSIDVRELPNGFYATSIGFHSASSVRNMRITVTAYDVERSFSDGSRSATAALPPGFLDLPQIMLLAKNSGVSGGLTRAGVGMYKGFGAVWRIVTDKRQAASFSAMTGERIRKDVTGYIVQSEKDWRQMAGIWREVIAKSQPRASDTFKRPKLYWSRPDTKSRCSAERGIWHDEGGIGKCR